jgi:hypothetical protein
LCRGCTRGYISWCVSVSIAMSTRVYDKEDESYDEVDIILASAKLGAPRKRYRDTKSRHTFNLSDIPENFAHVPSSKQSSSAVNAHTSSSSSSSCELPTHDDPQADDTSDETGQGYNRQQNNKRTFTQATVRWLRDRCKGCIRAVNETFDMAGVCACTRVTTAHAPLRSRRQVS